MRVIVGFLLILSLSACVVSSDDMRNQGIMGAMWQAAQQGGGPALFSDREKDLFDATRDGDLDKALSALEAGASISARDPEGTTLTALALRYNQRELLKLFLAKGAPVGAEDFCVAISTRTQDLLKELLAYPVELDQACTRGYTPLTRAVRFGDPEVVKALLALGANKNFADAKGRIPTDYAADRENVGGFPDWQYNYDQIDRALARAPKGKL